VHSAVNKTGVFPKKIHAACDCTLYETTSKFKGCGSVTRKVKLKVLNRNKLIVFVNQHFGIFPTHEVFMLANVPVHDIAKELNITREQVYAKYTDDLLRARAKM